MKKEEYQKLLEETKEVKTSKIKKSFDELNCIHTIIFKNNEKYIWIERNIFDFGTIFNPNFSIKEGMEKGGTVKKIDNKYYFETYGKKNNNDKYDTWYIVRELKEFELKSYLIAKYNSEFKNMIRL